ncbi:hypothetical protein PproGo58_58790 [Pseudomonas protegens]|nr:hypothetical protein PproGo58_58790 [Pseudomonas protegens]
MALGIVIVLTRSWVRRLPKRGVRLCLAQRFWQRCPWGITLYVVKKGWMWPFGMTAEDCLEQRRERGRVRKALQGRGEGTVRGPAESAYLSEDQGPSALISW